MTITGQTAPGLFDGAVKADLGLKPGELAVFMAGGEDLRKMIIIGTRFGNVVIFERYTPKDDGNENIVVVVNRPKLSRFVRAGAMSTETLRGFNRKWYLQFEYWR